MESFKREGIRNKANLINECLLLVVDGSREQE